MVSNDTTFSDGLRRWAEAIKDHGSLRHGAIANDKPRVAEEKKSSHQGLRGKQQGRICKQPHRRRSNGNTKVLPADESNFKDLVFKHTCMLPSPRTPRVVIEPTSPVSLHSNSSGLTWGSMSEATGRSISQPASPNTPTSLASNMGFSQPTSPLSHSRRPTSFSLSPLDEALSNVGFAVTCTENGVPHCASAPCLVDNNQAGWPQGTSSSVLEDWNNTHHLGGVLHSPEQNFIVTSNAPLGCVQGLHEPLYHERVEVTLPSTLPKSADLQQRAGVEMTWVAGQTLPSPNSLI